MSKYIFWDDNAPKDSSFETTTWYRCVGGEKFLDKVSKDYYIHGVTFEGNNVGFIIEKKITPSIRGLESE